LFWRHGFSDKRICGNNKRKEYEEQMCARIVILRFYKLVVNRIVMKF
jgi:hypothetical protein